MLSWLTKCKIDFFWRWIIAKLEKFPISSKGEILLLCVGGCEGFILTSSNVISNPSMLLGGLVQGVR